MKLIVGLGNPGLKYRSTRHNAGFLVVEAILKKFGIGPLKNRYKGLLAKGSVRGEKVGLFMPQTCMNLSGEAVRAAVRKEKIKFSQLLVICDDINLSYTFIRLKKKGSSGGHNGLESLIESLGTEEFARLRIGIGPEHAPLDMAKFVLQPFDSVQKPILNDIINEAADCALIWLKEGPDKAMNLFNRRQFS